MFNENLKPFFDEDVPFTSTGDGYASSIEAKLNPALHELMLEYSVFTLQVMKVTGIYAFSFEYVNTNPQGTVYPTSVFSDNVEFYRRLACVRHGDPRELMDWMDAQRDQYLAKREGCAGIALKIIKIMRGECKDVEIRAFYQEFKFDMTLSEVFKELFANPIKVQPIDPTDRRRYAWDPTTDELSSTVISMDADGVCLIQYRN